MASHTIFRHRKTRLRMSFQMQLIDCDCLWWCQVATLLHLFGHTQQPCISFALTPCLLISDHGPSVQVSQLAAPFVLSYIKHTNIVSCSKPTLCIQKAMPSVIAGSGIQEGHDRKMWGHYSMACCSRLCFLLCASCIPVCHGVHICCCLCL